MPQQSKTPKAKSFKPFGGYFKSIFVKPQKATLEPVPTQSKFQPILKKPETAYCPEEWRIILHNSSIQNSRLPLGL